MLYRNRCIFFCCLKEVRENMSNNEIKALILAIIMLSVLIYCIIMAIYFYRFESKKLSIISITAIKSPMSIAPTVSPHSIQICRWSIVRPKLPAYPSIPPVLSLSYCHGQ